MKPILDKNTKILILGTYPGERTIKKQEYYSHPGNRFWSLISRVVKQNIYEMDYQNKIRTLKQYRIGLWDVFESVKREGSSDNKIIEGELNDFTELKLISPKLETIYLNGVTIVSNTKKISDKNIKNILNKLGYNVIELYSSSGANNGNKKEEQWFEILDI